MELDLHGVRHQEVERLVENFVLLNEPPLTIITGNSYIMQKIVMDTLLKHSVEFEQWNSGCIKILK